MRGFAGLADGWRGKRRSRARDYSRVVLALMVWAASAWPLAASAQRDGSFEGRVAVRVHALVNSVRAEHGLHPLELDSRLDSAAAYFSGYMARSGNLDHSADGSTAAARVQQRGYSYCIVAENIAFEYNSRGFTVENLARNLVDGWLDSPTHRLNILGGRVTQTGVGVARSASGEYYATQLFALPVQKGRRCSRRAAYR